MWRATCRAPAQILRSVEGAPCAVPVLPRPHSWRNVSGAAMRMWMEGNSTYHKKLRSITCGATFISDSEKGRISTDEVPALWTAHDTFRT